MSNAVDPATKPNLVQIAILGGMRSLTTDVITYPLEVFKVRRQNPECTQSIYLIAKEIFQQKGLAGLYDGVSYQLGKTLVRQFYCWPMITGVPIFLRSYGVGDALQQVITGISVATVDALTTPLERAKILIASANKSTFTWKDLLKEGWQGGRDYWIKRSVNMITFLTAQKYLRESNRENGEKLPVLKLIKIAIQIAFVVSFVSAPFDFRNTSSMQSINPTGFFLRGEFFKIYRGWPMSFYILSVHQTASVIMLEKLS